MEGRRVMNIVPAAVARIGRISLAGYSSEATVMEVTFLRFAHMQLVMLLFLAQAIGDVCG